MARLGEDMLVKVIEINARPVSAPAARPCLLEEQGVEWKPEDTARPQRERGDRAPRVNAVAIRVIAPAANVTINTD